MKKFPVCNHAGKNVDLTIEPTGVARLADEPFRLFFPWGIIVSVLGVSLWPLFYAEWLPYAPHVPHARVMIEGFFSAFIIGFLGTAFPRMISAPRLTVQELGLLFALHVAGVVALLTGHVGIGDGCFVALIVTFVSLLGARFCFLRKSLPPPSFVFAGIGLCCALAGAVMLLTENIIVAEPGRHRLALLLLNQGFLLLPILGVGAFLFPRFFQGGSPPTGSWSRRAVIALAGGVVIVASFFVEAGGYVLAGRLVRAAVVVGFLGQWMTTLSGVKGKGTAALALRVGCIMLVVGLLAVAFYPLYQKGFDHLVFVSGFGLVALAVGSRVVLGHADRIDLVESKSRPMRWIIGLILIAALTRATADPIPTIAVSHHLYAAVLWIAAAAVWARWLWRKRKSM